MNEDDLKWENIEAETRGAQALNPVNGLTAEQAIAQQAKSELAQSATQDIASIPDGAIGYSMGGKVADALTPKLQRDAMARGATKLLPFLGKHVAPRLLAGGALSGVGPVGTGIGLIAPEAGLQAYNMLKDSGPRREAPTNTQYMSRMDLIAQQNPELKGTPEVLIRAMQGPANPLLSQLP